MNKTTIYINKILSIKNGFLILFSIFTFILPLIVSTNTNELYEFPKMYFVYFMGGSIICLYFLLNTFKDKRLPSYPIYIKLYLISFLVSSIYSIHLYTSFWGYYSRFNDSLISTLIFFGLYLVAKDKFSSLDFEKLIKVILFASVPISLVAISQHATEVRVYSTFGQANWLAQFMAMILPFANYLFFIDAFPLVWLVISILGFAGLWFTYSMSGLLGYGMGLCVLLFIYRKKLFSGIENRFNAYKLLFLLFIFEIIAVTNLGVFRLRLNDVGNDVKKLFHSTITKNVSALLPVAFAQDALPMDSSKESSSSNNPDLIKRNLSDPGFIRGGLWLGTINLIFSSPKVALIGTGPETFPYAFQKFRPKELNYSSEWNFVFNKPHNYFLEIASEQGLIGLGIYLYICFVLFKNLEKKYVPIFVAFLVTNIFGWPTVFTTYMFWLLLASLNKENAEI